VLLSDGAPNSCCRHNCCMMGLSSSDPASTTTPCTVHSRVVAALCWLQNMTHHKLTLHLRYQQTVVVIAAAGAGQILLA
jgi:hypothetical protein